MLRPAYVPPSRFQLSLVLLDEIFEEKPVVCVVLAAKNPFLIILDTSWAFTYN